MAKYFTIETLSADSASYGWEREVSPDPEWIRYRTCEPHVIHVHRLDPLCNFTQRVERTEEVQFLESHRKGQRSCQEDIR